MKQDLKVISAAKSLSRMIFEITDRSPKKFRFTIITRLQNLSLEIISCLIRANDIYVRSKLLTDIDKTISYIVSMDKFKNEAERIYYKSKLYMLRMKRAEKLEEIVNKRLHYSYNALTALKEVDWLIVIAAEMQCITKKQQERIALQLNEVMRLTYGFIKSDKKRFNV